MLPEAVYIYTAKSPDAHNANPKLLSIQKKKKKPSITPHSYLALMDKKKGVPASSAAAGSSRSAGSKAIEELKNLNTQLLNEVVENRQEIQHLQHQLAVATERLESATIELNAIKMRLHEAAGEKNAAQMELERILQLQKDLNLRSLEKAKRKNKWNKLIYPVAVTAAIFAATALATCCFKSWRFKN